MRDADVRTVVHSYLEAFHQRDLAACAGFFADNAEIHFVMGVHQGRQAIEDWHKDRFAADVRVTRVEGVRVEGETVSVDAVATSKSIRAWRLGELAGTATFSLRDGKIEAASFTLRTTIPIEGW